MPLRPLLLATLVGLLAPAAAAAQPPPVTFEAGAGERGWIDLRVTAPAGSSVSVAEQVGAQRVPVAALAATGDATRRRRAAPWRCDRRSRTFVAIVTPPGGGTAIEAADVVVTPTCRRRFAIAAATGRAGRGLAVTVRDRFGTGDVAATVCAAPARARLRCRPVRFAPGSSRAVARLAAGRPGPWRIELRSAYGQRARGATVLRRAGGRFSLLATGDSMIQIIDSFLDRRLEPKGGRVRSDAHISSGITRPGGLDWVAHARGAARSSRPDVTVVFLGANDGFALDGAACCMASWVDAYARRVRAMMASYLRGGRSQVYWMLLPAPRGGNFARVFRGVNAAVLRAASRFTTSEVRVLDLGRTFTPGGSFRQRIRYGGRSRSVRQADGVHLNVTGASIAADLVSRALRADGWLR